MRRALLIPTLLMCAACAKSGAAITSRVTSDRPIADARNCALYRLQSLGYTIIESHSSSGSVEGVKVAAPPEKTTDRINVIITSNSDNVAVGRPNNTLTITVHTLNPAGVELTPSGNVQADGVNVSTACQRQ